MYHRVKKCFLLILSSSLLHPYVSLKLKARRPAARVEMESSSAAIDRPGSVAADSISPRYGPTDSVLTLLAVATILNPSDITPGMA
jgi:hypothetical protein